MADKKNFTEVTAEQLIRRIDNEGLSYAVKWYYGRDITCTDDPKLDVLWKSAFDAIDALEVYVESIRDDHEES